jgi:glycosyltransferase involved in cell wall biosynthesis
VFNPLDLDRWFPDDGRAARAALEIPEGARTVVWHGRVVIETKGLDILLDAWSRLRADHRDLRLLLLGTGPDAPRLRSRIDRAGWGDVVWRDEYVSDRDAVRRFLAAGDIYAFPSRHEGFPVAPIEAMACSLPVIAADAPAVRDILPDGEASGGVIVPGNDPGALAKELAGLLADDRRRREVARRARARAVDSFSLAAIGQRLRGFLLGEGRGGHASEGVEEIGTH